MHELLAVDYIEVKIDQDRMPNGKAVAKELRQDDPGGMPWFEITDANANRLVTSIGPKGNVGCPVTEAEADWFFAMLNKTKKRLTAEQIKVLEAEHYAFAAAMGRR